MIATETAGVVVEIPRGSAPVSSEENVMPSNPTPIPAAACPRCGGWTSSGGCSQFAGSTTPVHGRTGCTCTRKDKRGPPVKFGRGVENQYGDLVYASKDGRFTITKRMMASMSGRAGCFTERSYYLDDTHTPLARRPVAHDTLADAKLAACQVVCPGYEPETCFCETQPGHVAVKCGCECHKPGYDLRNFGA